MKLSAGSVGCKVNEQEKYNGCINMAEDIKSLGDLETVASVDEAVLTRQ